MGAANKERQTDRTAGAAIVVISTLGLRLQVQQRKGTKALICEFGDTAIVSSIPGMGSV